MGQRIWLFHVWLTAVRIDRKHDISLFSDNLCHKCLCCVSVYVNVCNSFENVLKYQYITDMFVFLGGSVH